MGTSRATATAPARNELTRRERQVMDIVYARGRVSAADVQAALPDEPSYSATRMLLQRLAKKGLLTHETEGARYMYLPATPRSAAGNAAWSRLVSTFFGGSMGSAFSALLGESTETLSDEELDALERLVAEARKKRQ